LLRLLDFLDLVVVFCLGCLRWIRGFWVMWRWVGR